ncbi:MAG: ErfK/YbiS/YcfS/YnhG family protein [Bacteroidetes bacterium]|nr:MAG: ErfK/YbiS/YcfS/YnhG family protein [Bacteroidota bacterium]
MNRFLIPLFFLVLLSGCNGCSDKKDDKQVKAEDPEQINRLTADFIKEKISSLYTSKSSSLAGDTMLTGAWLKTFYTGREYKTAWTDKGKFVPAGDTLFRIVQDAIAYGLIPKDYHAALLDSLFRTAYDSTEENYNVTKLAQADILLTDAFFTFAVHVSTGRMAADTSEEREWHPQRFDSTLNIVTLLNEAIKNKNIRATIDSLEPKHKDYRLVKKQLALFRKEFANADWDTLPDIEKDTAAFYKALKPRLIAGHDYDTTKTGDDSLLLAEAIKKFQKRCGLEPDGKTGKLTRKALNMTKEDRIRQFAVNLERWRLEPRQYDKRHILVNIPAFHMKVMEEDTMVMESRIVVGAPKTQTPQLTSKITFMIMYPYWNVPYSIAWKEILPAVKRDTNYLHKKNFEVLDRNGNIVPPSQVNWSRLSKGNLPYKFRQRIGEDNSLGVLKFDFANKFGVYMHDTNSKRYFSVENRAQSHGCMRLEKYKELAYFLIREDSVKLPKDTFDVQLTQQVQRRIYVKKPLRLYVRYFTCFTDSKGNFFLLNDLYGRDERIMRVLYNEGGRSKKKYVAPAPTPATKA